MRPLALCLILLGLVAATAGLRAETYRFDPSVSFNTSLGARSPALRIKSGDRVITTTPDDLDTGAQTGPFYVEGAEPGDMVVVAIEKLEPNRTVGLSPSVMVPSSIDSGSLPNRRNSVRVPWTIDKARGVVRLDLAAVLPNVDWRARFSSPMYELPLRPMLGSLGVAPASDAFTTTTPGPFGGRMDYAGVTAGVTVMLPVFQPGALLFLGHGQARVGDGETGGAGLETSMNVEFSVELVKKKKWPHSSVVRPSTIAGEFPIEWPRIETGDYVMTVGSAASLLEALQHATSELHHWLDDDFGFSERSLSILLGQAIEYEIAHIADRNFSVVAKVRKSYMPQGNKQP